MGAWAHGMPPVCRPQARHTRKSVGGDKGGGRLSCARRGPALHADPCKTWYGQRLVLCSRLGLSVLLRTDDGGGPLLSSAQRPRQPSERGRAMEAAPCEHQMYFPGGRLRLSHSGHSLTLTPGGPGAPGYDERVVLKGTEKPDSTPTEILVIHTGRERALGCIQTFSSSAARRNHASDHQLHLRPQLLSPPQTLQKCCIRSQRWPLGSHPKKAILIFFVLSII